MEIIKGQKFIDLCDLYISKEEHTKFENIRNMSNWLDVDKLPYKNFDNPLLIYANSSLLQNKPQLLNSKFRKKLEYFKNPFILILHNSDANFEEFQIDVLKCKNLIRIYTQNLNINHPKISPLPIGIANDLWPWGNEEILKNIIYTEIDKTEFIYANFKIEGGLREIDRIPCKKIMEKFNISMDKNTTFQNYLVNLKRHKFCLCPHGNGYDTHRFWESLYLKTIPIVKKTEMTIFWKKYFPIVLLDEWEDLDMSYLEKNYDILNKWHNYDLLDFNKYVNKFINLDKKHD